VTAGSRVARVLEPPYLVTARNDRRALTVTVTTDASTNVVELTVHGRWSPELGNQVTATLRLCLAGPASAVIIDLHDVGDMHGVSVPFWIAAARTARLGPTPIQLALCLPMPTMLAFRLRQSDSCPLSLFATISEARRAIAERLSHGLQVQAQLPPQPVSVPTARNLVIEACRAWRLPHFHSDASLVVSELTANAVQHAGTDLVVTVRRSGRLLHMAVRDSDTRYPQLNGPSGSGKPVALDERGWGLQMVHAVTVAWGVMPTRGGKVVWATLSQNLSADSA
jgi:anti-sigma regulatory factor (Ser/Thr protein kinase)